MKNNPMENNEKKTSINYKLYGNGKLLLKVGTKVIGTIKLLDRDQPGMYISHLDIIESHSNKGYGTLIMKQVIKHLKINQSISLHVSVLNIDAIRFYQKFGFIIACTTTDREDKHYLMTRPYASPDKGETATGEGERYNHKASEWPNCEPALAQGYVDQMNELEKIQDICNEKLAASPKGIEAGKSLEECKDEYALKRYNTIWDRLSIQQKGYAMDQVFELYASQRQEWIHSDNKPKDIEPVLALCHTGGTKLAFSIVCYTKGYEIELEDFDDTSDLDEKNGSLFLKEGWYEECEQHSGHYDTIYIPRAVVCYQELPSPPTK